MSAHLTGSVWLAHSWRQASSSLSLSLFWTSGVASFWRTFLFRLISIGRKLSLVVVLVLGSIRGRKMRCILAFRQFFALFSVPPSASKRSFRLLKIVPSSSGSFNSEQHRLCLRLEQQTAAKFDLWMRLITATDHWSIHLDTRLWPGREREREVLAILFTFLVSRRFYLFFFCFLFFDGESQTGIHSDSSAEW